MAVQFNDTHFTQEASTTPWIAVFSCTESSKAGNASDLISNAQRLDAHAIIVGYAFLHRSIQGLMKYKLFFFVLCGRHTQWQE
jgi:hypothetical protein